jgi:hypothetical protein
VLAALIALVGFAAVALPLIVLNAWLAVRGMDVRDLAAVTLYVDLAVDPLPPGLFEAGQLSWRAAPEGTRLHRATFEEAEAVEALGRWLREAQDSRAFVGAAPGAGRGEKAT